MYVCLKVMKAHDLIADARRSTIKDLCVLKVIVLYIWYFKVDFWCMQINKLISLKLRLSGCVCIPASLTTFTPRVTFNAMHKYFFLAFFYFSVYTAKTFCINKSKIGHHSLQFMFPALSCCTILASFCMKLNSSYTYCSHCNYYYLEDSSSNARSLHQTS